MKQCPYCGTEYPDSATNCVTDGEALRDFVRPPPLPALKSLRNEPKTVGGKIKRSTIIGILIAVGLVVFTLLLSVAADILAQAVRRKV